MTHIAIIGAGQACSSSAFELRALGHTGAKTIIGGEAFPPYQRPPLSMGYLLGDLERSRLFLKPETSYAKSDICLILGAPVTGINATTLTIIFGDEALSYDDAILATGSTLILLSVVIGGMLNGVYSIRTLADIDAMAPEFARGHSVLIVGGWYIGLEAAAALAKMGLDITVVEMADRILQRVAAPQTSDDFRELHQRHGVKIRERISLKQLVVGAANIFGAQTEYSAKPWFWSDQFDFKLQIAGLNTGYDRVILRKGARLDAVSHWYYAETTLLAVDAMNASREFMIGRRLIERRRSPDPAAIADQYIDLKSLM